MKLDYGHLVNRLPATDGWIEALMRVARRALEAAKRVFIITIARKMARLFEFWRKHNSRLDSFISENSKNIEVITEHAIPLALGNANPSNAEVIILDDYIDTGDTVISVSEHIYWLTGIKPQIIAMAISDDEINFSFASVTYPVTEDENVINESLRPAFFSKNSWDVLSLGKSVDLEFTILRKRFNPSDKEKIISGLENSVQEAFPGATVYAIDHIHPDSGKLFRNVTACLNGVSHSVPNNDFNKIRFFIGDGEINIVSFAPNIWDNDIFENEHIGFFTAPLNRCWELYKENVYRQSSQTHNGVLAPVARMLEFNYAQRVKYTSVVFANYLLSATNILCFKDNILKSLKSLVNDFDDLELETDELLLLTGKDFADKIIPLLRVNLELSPLKNCLPYLRPGAISDYMEPLLPPSVRDDFSSEVRTDIYMAGSCDVALSLIFGRMRKVARSTGRVLREERINIGQTYDSLAATLKESFKSPLLIRDINRWIDSRIDLGIIVPRYEIALSPMCREQWRRYFRAGEREDLAQDWARLAYRLIGSVLEPGQSMSDKEFNAIIESANAEFGIDGHKLPSLAIFATGINRNNGKRSDEDFALLSLLVYLVRLGILHLAKRNDWSSVILNRSESINKEWNASPLY